jgi:hypothetical protein
MRGSGFGWIRVKCPPLEIAAGIFPFQTVTPPHRLEVLRLLQGEVYNRTEVLVWDAVRNFIETVENSDNHVCKSQFTSILIDHLVKKPGKHTRAARGMHPIKKRSVPWILSPP